MSDQTSCDEHQSLKTQDVLVTHTGFGTETSPIISRMICAVLVDVTGSVSSNRVEC